MPSWFRIVVSSRRRRDWEVMAKLPIRGSVDEHTLKVVDVDRMVTISRLGCRRNVFLINFDLMLFFKGLMTNQNCQSGDSHAE